MLGHQLPHFKDARFASTALLLGDCQRGRQAATALMPIPWEEWRRFGTIDRCCRKSGPLTGDHKDRRPEALSEQAEHCDQRRALVDVDEGASVLVGA